MSVVQGNLQPMFLVLLVAGVGPDTADAIRRRYPTPAALFDAFGAAAREAAAERRSVHDACCAVLAGMPIAGPARRMSTNLSSKIFDAFFGDGEWWRRQGGGDGTCARQ
jgi:hypothetical protein